MWGLQAATLLIQTSTTSSRHLMLISVLSVRPCGKMNKIIASLSLETTLNTMIWTAFHQYQYILWGQSKPMIVLWVHSLILAEIFLIREKPKYVQLDGILEFFESFRARFFLLSSIACDKIGPFSSCMRNTECLYSLPLDKILRHSHILGYRSDCLAGLHFLHIVIGNLTEALCCR